MLKSVIQSCTDYLFNFVWIPSYINIFGNELVDTAAKSALLNDNVTDVNILNLSNIYGQMYNYILNKWQVLYDEKLINHSYKQIENKVSFKSKYNCSHRKELVTISRLRLGYSKVNNTLFKWKKHPTGKCNYCDSVEDIEHFLVNCQKSPITIEIRNYCIKDNIPHTVQDLLASNRSQQLFKLISNRDM